MPRQILTRITLLLPAPLNLSDHYLVDAVLTDLVEFCDGATSSQEIPPVVTGRWKNSAGLVEEDLNLLIIADAKQDMDHPDLAAFLESLKFVAQLNFNQSLIWITQHRVERITVDDPKP